MMQPTSLLHSSRRAGLVLLGLLCLPFAVSAEEVPLLPPEGMDFSVICRKAAYDAPPGGEEDTVQLSPRKLYHLGRFYLNGNHDIPHDPVRAAQLFQKILETPASDIHAKAKYSLAKLLTEGKGISQDRQRAVALLEEAVDAQVRGAAYELGLLQEQENRFEQAAHYYRKGISAGAPQAAMALASLYRRERIATPSVTAGEETVTLAQNMILEDMAKGKCQALYQIGMLYLTGTAVFRNEAVSAQWLEAATRTDHVNAHMSLSWLYERGLGVEQDMQRVTALRQKAAELGSEEAMTRLGLSYVLGNGVEADRQQGIVWLERAGHREYLKAMTLLAKIHHGKYGSAVLPKEEAYWLKRAALHPRVKPSTLYALAAVYAEGKGASQDSEQAFALYEKAATGGDRRAILKLADAHLMGYGTPQNPKMSLRFYRLAASRGSTEAMLRMAENYEQGIGVARSPEKAERWMNRAIAHGSAGAMIEQAQRLREQGGREQHEQATGLLKQAARRKNRKAMVLLGLASLQGEGPEVAQQWFDKATAPGEGRAEALLVLSEAYREGQGVEKDADEARVRLEEAAASGHAESCYRLAQIYLSEAEEDSPSPKKAITLLVQAVGEGHEKAMLALAEILAGDPDFSLDDPGMTVPVLLTRAAQAGNPKAMRTLGRWHLKKAHNSEDAVAWFARAMTFGDTPSMVELGRAYASGRGLEKDVVHARRLFEKAATQGSAAAMREIGVLYMEGNGVKHHPATGVSWLHRAAQKGDAHAMYELANAYAAGFGIKESARAAFGWWQRAAEAGSREAREQLELAGQTGYGSGGMSLPRR